MADGHAHATLARGASHLGHRPAVPRAFQVVSDPRGRSFVDGAALCGAKSIAGESGGTGRRVAVVEPLASRDGAAAGFWTRGRCLCRGTGDNTCSRRRRRRSWRHYGVRWCAALRLERMRGEIAPQSVWACTPRCVRAAALETPPIQNSESKTPDPFVLPDVTVGDNGVLDMNGFDNQINTLSGTGTVENSFADSTATLAVGNDSTDSTFSGVLTDGAGQLALDKIGGDTLTLSNANNAYTGQTTVEAGVLSTGSSGSVASSAVLLDGGQLDPSGTYGPVTVETTVVVTSDADPSNPPVYGNAVTFTATVSAASSGYGTPGGAVEFWDESTGADLGSGIFASGVYTLGTSNLDAEDHYIVAVFSPGDGSVFVASTSDAFDQEVHAATTSTTVSVSDPSPANVGQFTFGDSLTFTATVSPQIEGSGPPSGSVEFYDGSTDLGAGTPGDPGQWTFSTSVLALGSHTIAAVYSGDNNFAGSQSDPSQSG